MENRHARDMSDSEYAAAKAAITRPARSASAAPVVAPAAPPLPPGTSTGTTSRNAPAPPPAPMAGQRNALTMTDAEYRAARAELTRPAARPSHGSR
jgi:hypothetical protein